MLQGITHHDDCYSGFNLCCLSSTGSAYCGSVPTVSILRYTMRGCLGIITVLQLQPSQSQIPSQAYAHYAMGPPQVSFLIQSWASHWFIMFHIDVMVFAFCFRLTRGCYVHQWGLDHWDLQCSTLWRIPLADMCFWAMVHGPYQECSKWLLLLLLWVGGICMLLIQLTPSHSINIVWGIQLWGLSRESVNLFTFHTW